MRVLDSSFKNLYIAVYQLKYFKFQILDFPKRKSLLYLGHN